MSKFVEGFEGVDFGVDVESTTEKSEPLPAGKYVMKVTKVSVNEDKTPPVIMLSFAVADGEFKGRYSSKFLYFTTTKATQFSLRALYSLLGEKVSSPKELDERIGDYIGCYAKCTTTVNDKGYSNVEYINPLGAAEREAVNSEQEEEPMPF